MWPLPQLLKLGVVAFMSANTYGLPVALCICDYGAEEASYLGRPWPFRVTKQGVLSLKLTNSSF